MLTRRRCGGSSTSWGCDDPGSERRAGVAGDRAHRYAQGLSGVGPRGAGALKRDPHNGHLFVFRGRRGDLIKVLWHDGQGACLFSKRLERGRFLWPSPADGVVTITPAQLGYLLEGIDWRMPQKSWRPMATG
jgi:transposase